MGYRFIVSENGISSCCLPRLFRDKRQDGIGKGAKCCKRTWKKEGRTRNTIDAEKCVVPCTEEAVERISIDIEHSTVQKGKNILDFVTVLAYPSLSSLFPSLKVSRESLPSLFLDKSLLAPIDGQIFCKCTCKFELVTIFPLP